jgi:hypothetical protein
MRPDRWISPLLAALAVLPASASANDGRLIVTIEPEGAKFDRARWRLNDSLPMPPSTDPTDPTIPSNPVIDNPTTSSWRRSDVPLENVPDGIHIVEFEDIGAHSVCKRPSSVRIEVRTALPVHAAGLYDCNGVRLGATAVVRAAIQNSPIGITVTILPAAAVHGGAAWRVKGETTWRASGSTFAAPPDGVNIVEYRAVLSGACDKKPADEVIEYYSGQAVDWKSEPYQGAGC